MTKHDMEVKIEDVKKAYRIAAKVVSIYGDTYLPLFQRLHDELEKLENASKLKLLALNVACAIDRGTSKE